MPSLSRRLTAGVATATAALLVLAGCSAGGSPTDETTLTFAVDGANLASHLDPHSTLLDIGALVQRATFDSLVFQGADGSITPWLATAWEVSDDELTYTFQLRDDVTFHDGTAFDAAAVVANIEHVIAPETASAQAAASIGFDSEDPEAGAFEGVEATGDYEVAFTFRRPFVTFLQALATTNLGIYSPTALAEHADDLKTGGPGISVGSGPYILSELVADQEIVYTANPDYTWGPDGGGVPAIDRLVVRIVPEESVRIAAFNSGDVDAVGRVSPTALADLTGDAQISNVSLPGLPYSLYVNQKHGVFTDPLVRDAFRIGFDIDTPVDAIFDGKVARAWSILAPTTPDSYDASLEGSWPYDPDAAETLLDEAGWTERDAEGYRTKGGQRLSAVWAAWTPVSDANAALADSIQSDLKKIGFELVREQLEPAQYNERYATLDFDLTDWGFASGDADILRNHLHSAGFQNASAVSDPQLDAILEQAVATSDTAERARLYTEVQQWNQQNVAIVPLYLPAVITIVSPAVSGLTYDIEGRPLFATASLATS